jgi:hypothetical protein
LVNASLQQTNLNSLTLGEFLHGWIARIPLDKKNNLELNHKLSQPNICFYYPDDNESEEDDKQDKLPFYIQNNEIVICRQDNDITQWKNHIQSVFIVNWDINEEAIQILTIEGEDIRIDIKNGQPIPVNDTNLLRCWHGADLAGVVGLDEKEIYLLELLGALNLPNNTYEPRNDSEINISLKQ